jgi:hypothetical protein
MVKPSVLAMDVRSPAQHLLTVCAAQRVDNAAGPRGRLKASSDRKKKRRGG